MLGQDQRFKRIAGLCAVEYQGDLRRNERFCAPGGHELRRATSGQDRVADGQGLAPRKSIHRLEPKRPSQNNRVRVFPARERPADGIDADKMVRSRKRSQRKNQTVLQSRRRTRAGQKIRRPVRTGADIETKAAKNFLKAPLDRDLSERRTSLPGNWPGLNATCHSNGLSRRTSAAFLSSRNPRNTGWRKLP